MTRSHVIDRDRGWNDLLRQARKSRRAHVAVGILARNDGRDDGSSNVEIGTIHEYGAPEAGIPERSFIRATIDANETVYRRLIRHLGDKLAAGSLTATEALGLFGARVVADIKRRIQAGIAPALKPATIRRKKSSKPLIDTAQLVNSITYEVQD
jgi:phage gpG-like protein